MSIKTKVLNELQAILWTTLYFLCWFGSLMVLKVLLLHEYQVDFFGASAVVVGALIAAKAVLILENVNLTGSKSQAAYIEILLRTLLYLAGIFVILVLEKSFEGRHEYSGFFNAFKNLANSADGYHIWVNTLCVFGALLFYNLGSVVKKYLGKEDLKRILLSPVPEQNSKE